MPRTVIFAYDHSEASYNALTWVISHDVLLETDKVYVLTVMNDEVLSFEGFGLEAAAIGPATWVNDDCGEQLSKIKEDAHRLLESVVKVLKENGIEAIPKAVNGDAGDVIVDQADALKADMVIVGSNGRGFIKRQLLGSVSEHLTLNLKCSVLVVK
ncbi:adenine nucleotide alpha hydrolases-like protein, partial [Hesseltinella vesiculosa]